LTFVDQNYGESGIVMLTRRHILIALGVLPATAALGACGHSTSKTGGNAGTAVTFLTGYGTTPRETFPWVGLAKGFFSEAGIDLTVLPGQPSDANLKTLAAGKAQFAAVDFVSAIRGTKAFPDYRTVMAVQSSTLLSMVTLAGRGIGKPTDLAGRTLGTAPAAATQTLFPTYAKKPTTPRPPAPYRPPGAPPPPPDRAQIPVRRPSPTSEEIDVALSPR
jgi:NitT/TauT family transport system substrate-binding protein